MSKYQDTIPVTLKTGEVYELSGRPCEISSFSYVPPKRCEEKDRTYFNVDKQHRYSDSTYDRLFQQDYGYNEKLHRDDREHAKSRGLTVYNEEMSKKVPALSSAVYGHRLPSMLDNPDRKHVRIACVQTEFYRRNNINVKPATNVDEY